ncbi:MAG: class 1 fructose-bisphosphatase [Cyanobacteria bacterium P01_C01_bin.72]
MSNQGITLNRHLWQQYKEAKIELDLLMLLEQMAFAGKILAQEISRAALVGHLGLAGEENATGDPQKKLDVYSNQVVIDAFMDLGLVAAIASEELDEVEFIDCGKDSPYILCTDPLDGSSNTDTAGSLGTIFGIYRRLSEGFCGTEADALRQGTELVASGYILYSTSTILVFTNGVSVNGFTLDPNIGEFILSHPEMRIPESGKIYSANLSYASEWHPHLQAYLEYLTSGTDSKQPSSLRYAGALVGDFHRCLLQGGLYFYPATNKQQQGKLRLLYESAPLALIAETAGGSASTGQTRILDLQAESIHQRSPLAIGSTVAVSCYEQFLQTGKPQSHTLNHDNSNYQQHPQLVR